MLRLASSLTQPATLLLLRVLLLLPLLLLLSALRARSATPLRATRINVCVYWGGGGGTRRDTRAGLDALFPELALPLLLGDDDIAGPSLLPDMQEPAAPFRVPLLAAVVAARDGGPGNGNFGRGCNGGNGKDLGNG